MTKAQVEVITSVQRRRRWTAAEKERIVAASLERALLYRRWLARRGFIQANCTAGGGRFALGRGRRRISRRCGSHPTRWLGCRRPCRRPLA
jgi:transposase-like protein